MKIINKKRKLQIYKELELDKIDLRRIDWFAAILLDFRMEELIEKGMNNEEIVNNLESISSKIIR